MALILIGSGIAFDFTLDGIESLKSCDQVYIERYTNPIEDSKLSSLEEKIGKTVNLLGRGQVESNYLIDKAKNSDIALIASGDPLTATTHVTLLIEAREKNIPVKIIHNSSIYSAAPARAGLQIYRFGKTASLVNPRENYKPTSSLGIIRTNLDMNMHSLVLLDTEPKPMGAKAALEMLGEFELAVVISRLGETDEKIAYGKIEDLKNKDLGRAPFCVIIPAKLHMLEEEYLTSFSS
jgi:diphthine synthase